MTQTPIPPGAQIDTSLMGADHVRRYQETNGEVGYLWNGAPILLLTTKGRKSGEWHTTPLIFARHADKVIVIASKGGAPAHPAWYLNLHAEPRVTVQIKADRFDAIARTARSPEREILWAAAVAVWPRFNSYAERTTRAIPVVVFD